MVIDRIVGPDRPDTPDRPDRPDRTPGATDGVLAGQTALVTGAARRIGRALAVALAGEGVRVVLHHRRSGAEAVDLAAEIAAAGGRAWPLAADLADPEATAGLLPEAARLAGAPIRILINNASIFAQGDLAGTTVAAWDHNQAVNLRAPFQLAQALARDLPDGLTGNIINLNDIRALRPGPDHFPYTISKVGLHGLTRSLALALAPRIRVNELALGAVLPPAGAPESYVHTLRAEIPSGRFGSPDEVTAAVLYLLAGETLTGQTLYLDGGRHLV